MTNRSQSALVLALAFLAASDATAQLIPVKTIPVAASEQFSFFPTAGRTGFSLTLADTLLDPFRNPARAARLGRSQYFGAPSFFTVSENAGGGTTFPMGIFLKRGATFGGLGAAFQEIENSSSGTFFGGGDVLVAPVPGGANFEETPRYNHNNYAFALLGRSLGGGTSVAGSVLWSGLRSLDGVDQFYNGNSSLRQLGDAVDLRLGLTKDFAGGGSIEAIALRHRFDMHHDVGFTDFVWDPALRQPVPHLRTEKNDERANVWGLHLEYEHPLDSGWRVGALATTNVIRQPNIPNYEITSGLGREGEATAMNLGVGIGRTIGQITFGMDAIYEPIISKTWVRDTLDNRFKFHNAILRGGIGRDFKLLTPGNVVRMHFNSEYHWVNYFMEQDDKLANVDRTRRERWLERGRGGGVSFVTPTLQLHYQVQSRTGVGRPGVLSQNQIGVLDISSAPWMPTPTVTTLGAVSVTRHQFSISVPVR